LFIYLVNEGQRVLLKIEFICRNLITRLKYSAFSVLSLLPEHRVRAIFRIRELNAVSNGRF